MRSTVLVIGLLAVLAVVAALLTVGLKSREEPAEHALGAAPAARAETAGHEAHGHEQVAVASPDDLARARQEELVRSAPTFRNTTLLIAVRGAGYPCADLIEVAQIGDELAPWRVACAGALAYLVAVDASGELVVDPMVHGDGVSPVPGRPSGPIQILPETPPLQERR